MESTELARILKDYELWLNNRKGKKANPSDAKLSGEDLIHAELFCGNLSENSKK